MKQFFLLGRIIFLSLLLIQCKHCEKDHFSLLQSTSSGYAKITGRIHNLDVYPHVKDVTVNVCHISGMDRVTQIKVPINNDGTFRCEIDLARPQDVTIMPYVDFLYLIPGDSLHIELNFKNLQDVRVSGGKSAEINRDFFKYFNATGYRSFIGVGTDCTMNCTWPEIMKILEKARYNNRQRRQDFLRKTKVCDEVVFLTEAMIEMDYYSTLVSILRTRDHYGKETMNKDTLMNEINEVTVKYFNSDFYSNTHFGFAYTYIGAASLVKPYDEVSDDFIDWAKDVAKTDVIKNFILTIAAGRALKMKDLETFEKYSPHVNDDYLFDRLMQEYRIVLSNMADPENLSSNIMGVRSGDFAQTISPDKNNILAPIITPNEGKVHIISINAYWCRPCHEVLELYGALIKEYAGKDVCFSFICVTGQNDQTRELYRSKGIDAASVYYATNEESFFLLKTFAPMGYPYGILLNKKGVIVDYGGHVRPELGLREKINLLLEQDNLIK